MFKKAAGPNLLDSNLIKKLKDIVIGTRAAGGVISRRQILNIAKCVVKADNPSSLQVFSRTLELTNRWARDLLDSMEWNKRRETTGNIESLGQILSTEKLMFQRAISTALLEYNILTSLIVNLDQTPLSYVCLNAPINPFVPNTPFLYLLKT